jgi:hypothetical protein
MLHSASSKIKGNIYSVESDALTQEFIYLLLCCPFSYIYIYIYIDGPLLIYINLSQIPGDNKTNKPDAHHYVNIDLSEHLSP